MNVFPYCAGVCGAECKSLNRSIASGTDRA
jgi:hypothetical protein